MTPIPQCMKMITPESVAGAVMDYYRGGVVDDPKTVRLHFPHGFGDCSQVVFLLELYRRRGYRVVVHVDESKRTVFDIAGLEYSAAAGGKMHAYSHPGDWNRPSPECDWSSSKLAHAINDRGEVLPPIDGTKDAVWDELCGVRFEPRREDFTSEIAEAEAFVKDLPRPLVLTHTTGTNWPDVKNLTNVREVWQGLLDAGFGVVELDWDLRVPELRHPNFRSLRRDWEWLSLRKLAGLYLVADLMIGVDSGPWHFSALFPSLPSIGVYHGLHPTSFAVPRPQSLMLSAKSGQGIDWTQANPAKRARWNLVEYDGATPSAAEIVKHARRMLNPRYCGGGRDAVLQHLVHDRSRHWFLDCHVDRWKTFDAVLSRKPKRILETGCQRESEDFGAGASSLIFGLYVDAIGGTLDSVDLDPKHCELARQVTAGFRGVTVHEGDSLAFLAAQTQRADLIYLDSLDTYEPGHEEHCLAEAKIAAKLTDAILIDDTPHKGKGAQAIPWLVSQGWRIAARGYQCLLVKDSP